MEKTIQVGIVYGAMCDPISKQLKKQKLKFDPKKVDLFQKEADAILRLKFGTHILTDSMADKCRNKLHKAIVQHVAKENNKQVLKK